MEENKTKKPLEFGEEEELEELVDGKIPYFFKMGSTGLFKHQLRAYQLACCIDPEISVTWISTLTPINPSLCKNKSYKDKEKENATEWVI